MNALRKTSLSAILLSLSLSQLCVGQAEKKEEAKPATAESKAEKNELRTWKDSSGKFEVPARFSRADGETVLLERQDGKLIRVPLDRLSDQDRDYLRQLQADNPFGEEETAAVPRSAESLVTVVIDNGIDNGGKNQIRLGYVYRKTDDLAYVVIRSFGGEQPNIREQKLVGSDGEIVRVFDKSTANSKITCTIYTEAPERRAVKTTLVREFRTNDNMIVTAPAAEMPDPIKFNFNTNVKRGDTIKLIGYEFDYSDKEPTAVRKVKTAVVTNVLEKLTGGFSALHVEAENAGKMNRGLAIDQAGNVLGLFHIRSPGNAKTEFLVSEADLIGDLEKPAFGTVQILARSRDRKEVNYQIVAVVIDPLDKIKSAHLLVKPLLNANERPNVPADQAVEPLQDAREVKLTKREPDAVVRLQFDVLIPAFKGDTFVADFTTDNPGSTETYNFQIQVAYTNPDGELVYEKPQVRSYSPGALIRMEELADRGWKLTSATTAVTDEIKHGTKVFPVPAETNVSVVEERERLDEVDAIRLNIKPDAVTPLMTYSGDGDYFYLVDQGETVLRRIRSADLTQVATLDIGVRCCEIAYSKAGIVLALPSTEVVWVVDEKTLKVKFEIPVQGVSLVAANPTTAIGFAGGSLPTGNGGRSSSSALFMLDLAEGQILHQIQSSYGPKITGLSMNSGNFMLALGARSQALRMSPDGAHVYSADGNARIRRFRLDGHDLIFEEVGEQHGSGKFFLSVDGKWAALPPGFTTDGGYRISVFETQDLKKQKLDVVIGSYANTIGFDPLTGAIYVPGRQEMHIFTATGGSQAGFEHGLGDPRLLIVHPQGERFITWGNRKVVYYDLNQKRTLQRVEADADE